MVMAMLESAMRETIELVGGNPALLTCAAAMALMLAALIACSVRARKVSTSFALGRLEQVELDRAVLLYEKVVDRLREIDREASVPQASLMERYRHRRRMQRKFAGELADLGAYASHLRATIVRLRRRPLQRYRSWLRIHSSRFALSRSLVAYMVVISVLMSWFLLIEQHILLSPQALTEEVNAALAGFVELEPVQDRLLYAHSMALGFLPVIASYFYLFGRSRLRGEHRGQLRLLKTFAAAHPDRLIQRRADDEGKAGQRVEAPLAPVEGCNESAWFSVLGLPPSAGIDEVKQAYKMQIKKNHPDRVADMSPSFRRLAERETKKLNAAYQEALLTLQQA
jgi:hypothetical protein